VDGQQSLLLGGWHLLDDVALRAKCARRSSFAEDTLMGDEE
jgi:hypothetical protein